MDKDRFGRASN
jgi:hypothetical protein